MKAEEVQALRSAELERWLAILVGQFDLAGFLLLLLVASMLWVLWRAASAEGFDIKDVLRDDNKKPSFTRVAGLGAFAFSSWVLMKDVLSANGAHPEIFWSYIIVWSGAPIASDLVKALEAKWTSK